MIWFNNDKARKHLIEKGEVITARKSRSKTGHDKAVYTDQDGIRNEIGKVLVSIINESNDCLFNVNHREVLKLYLDRSGFDTVEDWIKAIREFDAKRKLPVYLKILEVRLL